MDYLLTHWEFFLLLPVLADRRRLGTASVHSVVRVVICDERSQVICNVAAKLTVSCAQSVKGPLSISLPYLYIQVYRELAEIKQTLIYTSARCKSAVTD